MEDTKGMARCALNPRTMQSKKYKLVKTASPKKVAVIGGGIGGMESAMVLAARGHQVTLYEKSDKLGGIFIQASAPSFKDKDRQLIEWYRRMIEKVNVQIVMNTEISDIQALDADAVSYTHLDVYKRQDTGWCSNPFSASFGLV